MSIFDDFAYLMRKRLRRMCWYEPRCLDVVFVPKPQQTINAYSGTKDTAGHISWVGRGSSLGVQP